MNAYVPSSKGLLHPSSSVPQPKVLLNHKLFILLQSLLVFSHMYVFVIIYLGLRGQQDRTNILGFSESFMLIWYWRWLFISWLHKSLNLLEFSINMIRIRWSTLTYYKLKPIRISIKLRNYFILHLKCSLLMFRYSSLLFSCIQGTNLFTKISCWSIIINNSNWKLDRL